MYALHHTSRRNEAHIVNLSNGKKTEKKRKKKKSVWPDASLAVFIVGGEPATKQAIRVEPK
jgi:hypothetical protein